MDEALSALWVYCDDESVNQFVRRRSEDQSGSTAKVGKLCNSLRITYVLIDSMTIN